MLDTALIDRFESDLDLYIEETHKAGYSYWSILETCLLLNELVSSKCIGLMVKSHAEYLVKGGK